ncbi:hypothetical protein TNCT_82621 [Trichonephila clavata]|uniref:Uncharacterized protein n=1 Tax=Trichonephila clavata TaxID=2740835 RepID=A0A8X6I560_TRICU|nr:hypothetical protein TNCT_82621 [Trichonephila clavata]
MCNGKETFTVILPHSRFPLLLKWWIYRTSPDSLHSTDDNFTRLTPDENSSRTTLCAEDDSLLERTRAQSCSAQEWVFLDPWQMTSFVIFSVGDSHHWSQGLRGPLSLQSV